MDRQLPSVPASHLPATGMLQLSCCDITSDVLIMVKRFVSISVSTDLGELCKFGAKGVGTGAATVLPIKPIKHTYTSPEPKRNPTAPA